MGWLNQVEFWHWWVLAGTLLVLELTTQVFFFLWMSFAAAAVGFLLLVFPSIPIVPQLVIFTVLSAVAVVAWRRHRAAHPAEVGPGALPRRDCLFVLQQPIVNGSGSAQLEGSTWEVKGPDLPSGARVRIVSVEDGFVTVEAAEEA